MTITVIIEGGRISKACLSLSFSGAEDTKALDYYNNKVRHRVEREMCSYCLLFYMGHGILEYEKYVKKSFWLLIFT